MIKDNINIVMFIIKVFRPLKISDLQMKEKNIDQVQNILLFYLEHHVTHEKVK